MPGDTRDSWIVRAKQHVGVLTTSDVQVLVRPKIPIPNILLLLESDGQALRPADGLFDYAGDLEFAPAFATLYARRLESALAAGAMRAYVANEEELVTPRGRVDLARHVRTGWQILPVPCRFDEYQIDTPLNRLLVAAAERLARIAGVAAVTRRSLGRSLQRFEGVGPLRQSDTQLPHAFSRLDAHFRPAERLARIALDAGGVKDQVGRFTADAFFVDMNRLFEEFISNRLASLLSGRFAVGTQHRVPLDLTGFVRMIPDLVLRAHGDVVAVADVKYKVTSEGIGRTNDYYQLLAYTTALNLRFGLLIYCQSEHEVLPRGIVVKHSGQALRTYAVSLDGNAADIEAEMRRLAVFLTELSDASIPSSAAA
jgi:5-methylcytosine-specific restriction enzyme subunit McrC